MAGRRDRERNTNAWCLTDQTGCHAPVNPRPLCTIRGPEFVLLPLRLPRLLLVLIACATCLFAGPTAHSDAGDGEKPAANAQDLQECYAKLLKHTDFSSFSERMRAVRQMGTLDCPQARQHLMRIATTAKSLDDRIVAITSLGERMGVAEAKLVAETVRRKRNPLLTQALAHAFILATNKHTLTWLATDAFGIRDPSVLQAVVDAQTIHADPRARPRLHAVFVQHRDKPRTMALAYASLRAIGTIADARDRSFLLRVPGFAEWRLRLAGAETIARLKPVDINVRGAIVEYLGDASPVVREAAITSTGRAGIVELTDNIADRLEDEHIRTRAVAHAALMEMHGKDLGWDPADWKRWWKKRTDLPKDIQQHPSSSVTTYYGVKVHSDRILFIIDLSGSMAFPWGAEVDKTRIGVAKRQLLKAIDCLEDSTLFNVIVFSDKVKSWRRKGEVKANAEHKADARQWIEKTFEKPTGGTFMHAALETAFAENPQVDTIFLLTDGLATDGEPIVPEAILASVNRWNRFRRVVVHTFALTLEDLSKGELDKKSLADIKRFMHRLAGLTGGECRIVTTPPKAP